MSSKILDAEDHNEIEEIVGHPLSDTDLVVITDIENLPLSSVAIVAKLAQRSKPLALKYLREIAPGFRLGTLIVRMEDILSSATQVEDPN